MRQSDEFILPIHSRHTAVRKQRRWNLVLRAFSRGGSVSCLEGSMRGWEGAVRGQVDLRFHVVTHGFGCQGDDPVLPRKYPQNSPPRSMPPRSSCGTLSTTASLWGRRRPVTSPRTRRSPATSRPSSLPAPPPRSSISQSRSSSAPVVCWRASPLARARPAAATATSSRATSSLSTRRSSRRRRRRKHVFTTSSAGWILLGGGRNVEEGCLVVWLRFLWRFFVFRARGLAFSDDALGPI